MKAIQIISQDLFNKIRSRFENLEMGDDAGSVTIDPAEARFFDFDFVYENATLGRVSISLNDPGALKIYYSQGLTENQEEFIKKYWYNFLKEMRQFAMRRLLRFDTRDIAKANLDQNDFQYLASKKSKDDETMNMNESRWMLEKSSKKTSRAVKGRTQVIVRHTESMAERRLGDRSNPKRIKAIYIENADGERFKYPFIHPAGAFAMAQHVDHGGIPHDPAGKAIIRMSEQIAQLQEFRRQVQSSTLNDDATGITERAIGRLQELKSRVDSLGKRHHYEAWISEFNETEHNDEMLSELDPVTFESYKSTFTQNNFNEALGKLFPLIHSIMQEKINLEDYVEEGLPGDQEKIDVAEPKGKITGADLKKLRSAKKEDIEAFEEWAEAVESGQFDRQALDDKLQGMDLTEKLSSIKLGPDGSLAWGELSELFGLDERDTDDAALKDQLTAKAKTADQEESGIEGPVMDVFKSWIEDSFPEWKTELPELFPDEQQMTPEPETGMQPAPAPQPGVNPGATPSPEMGMNPAPKPGTQPVAEDNQSEMIKEIAKLVKSRFNESNPTVGPFNGHEGILIDVEKNIQEKFGEKAGAKARLIAEKFMEKLAHQWKQKHHHGDKLMGEKSEIERLRELIGNVKAKVENLNQPQEEGMLDKAKQFGKKVLDVVAPDDATLLRKLEKDSGGRIPPQFEPKPAPKNEMAEILKLSGIKS